MTRPSTSRLGTTRLEVRARVVGRPDAPQHLPQVAGDGAFVDRPDDRAVLDPEAAGAARVVAGRRVDRGADQRGHQQAGSHLRDQRRRGSARPGSARGCRRPGPAAPRCRAPRCRCSASRAGAPVARSSVQPVSTPSATSARRAAGSPSPSNGREPEIRGRAGSSIRSSPAGSTALAERILEPARAARDGAAVDRLHQVADQPGGHPLVEEHRERAGRRLARRRPCATARSPASRPISAAVRQLGPVRRGSRRRSRAPSPCPRRRSPPPGSSARCRRSRPRSRWWRRGARGSPLQLGPGRVHLADAGNRQRRRLGLERRRLQRRGARQRRRIDQVERRQRPSRARARSGSASPHHGSSGASRAIATARSAMAAMVAARVSLDDTQAWRRPISTRSPRSTPSERSACSSAPSRTSIDRLSPATAIASAASAPAPAGGVEQPPGEGLEIGRHASCITA